MSLGGYSTYSGILDVDESSKVVEIDLAEEIVSEDLTDISNANTSNSNTSNSNTSNSTDKDNVNNKEDDSEGTSPSLEDDSEEKEGDQENKDSAKETRKVDNEHKIKVEKPIGAEVYLNGVLKGTVPCSFTKEIGTHTITFSKNGYLTKSYTVAVLDDSKDISFSFPDMEATQ